MMKKIIIDYSRLRDSDLLSFAKVVAQHMDDNANFPNLVPTVADMRITLASYETALTDAGNGDRQAISRKKTLKKQVANQLRQWAMYVNTASQGDMDKLNSSNFKMSKTPEPSRLSVPVIKEILQGDNPGTLRIIVENQPGIKSLIYQIAMDPITETTEWESFGDSRCKFEFSNLEEGKKYWIRVIAVGANNQRLQSAETAQFVLQRTMTKAA